MNSPAEDARQPVAADIAPSAEETADFGADPTPNPDELRATLPFLARHSLRTEDAPPAIGRYLVVEVLGQGSFGRVWRARDDDLRRDVAVKVLFDAPSEETPRSGNWLTEARALAALDHPNIVPIYDVGRLPSGEGFIVSKFISGSTLQDLLRDRCQSGFEPASAAEIAVALAEALHHAHERNLVHRDVKPANVLVEEATGRVYLADFGLATVMATEHFIAGTLLYMSPEQLAGKSLDRRSDLYTLGLVFYEILAGRKPFDHAEAGVRIPLMRESAIVPLQEAAPNVPPELVRICHKALARNPDDRYASCRDFACDLRSWQDEELRKNRLHSIPNNLPAIAERLVGRDAETAALQALLGQARLLTLTGPGGIGKTRLALQVAAGVLSNYADGAFLVELAPLTEAALVPAAIAKAVACRISGQRLVLDELLDWLSTRQILLVLDNCEHLPGMQADIARLLSRASRLAILATSRSPLHVAGEQEFPLSLLEGADAVQLFMQRAREALPALEESPEVAEICRRLDGLPLAIELAAARIKILSPKDLLARLQTNFQLLFSSRTGIPPRQQTLRKAISWSYELLPAEQQELFRRLAIFSGGFSLDAAAEVIGGDEVSLLEGVTALVDSSLLRAEQGTDTARFSMLETIREFSREMLSASGEVDELGRRHAAWVVKLAETSEPELRGARTAEFTHQLECEHPNIRAALAWSLADTRDGTRGEVGLRIAGSLWRFWCSSGHLREANQWYTRLLSAFGAARTDGIGAKALYAAGCVAEDLAEYSRATQLYEGSRHLWEQAGDEGELCNAYIALGSIDVSQGNYAVATESFEKCLTLARKIGDRRLVSVALSNLGSVAWSQADYVRARQFQQEALAIRRELGNRSGVAVSLTSLGLIASRLDDLQGAKILYTESLAILREIDNKPGIAVCLNNLGEISYRLAEFESGEAMLWEALRLQHDIGDRLSMAYTLESIASAAQLQGSSDAAVKFFAAAEALREEIGAPLPPPEKVNNDQIIQEARLALGPQRFIALWTAAKTVPLEKLVEAGP